MTPIREVRQDNHMLYFRNQGDDKIQELTLDLHKLEKSFAKHEMKTTALPDQSVHH